MPERKTINRALQKAREGKRPTTQAGEFVREEIKHIRRGKHGARSAKQAIAIGLSKARRAGVPLPPPKKRKTSKSSRSKAEHESRMWQAGQKRKTSRRRARATLEALRHEKRGAASHKALSHQARQVARHRAA